MILKSIGNDVVLIDCVELSSTEMSVGLFYVEGNSQVVTMSCIDTGQGYKVILPVEIKENNTVMTGSNVEVTYEKI